MASCAAHLLKTSTVSLRLCRRSPTITTGRTTHVKQHHSRAAAPLLFSFAPKCAGIPPEVPRPPPQELPPYPPDDLPGIDIPPEIIPPPPAQPPLPRTPQPGPDLPRPPMPSPPDRPEVPIPNPHGPEVPTPLPTMLLRHPSPEVVPVTPQEVWPPSAVSFPHYL
ncbi:vegetative cell wall protein gp1-like [Zingiber officinale]|uniref:vegetative cell wall protein gp1-like n=1 Tax=Zingiber officinale TaxID=94328 RepID=UPI001C4C570C|nr:vegetative cell wall protein gp1-like [Zingiber officinale]